MLTIDLMEEALETARRLGYQLRQEWLDGSGGGACQFGGKSWLFIDLSLNTGDQLDQVVTALSEDPRVARMQLSAPLAMLLRKRLAA